MSDRRSEVGEVVAWRRNTAVSTAKLLLPCMIRGIHMTCLATLVLISARLIIIIIRAWQSATAVTFGLTTQQIRSSHSCVLFRIVIYASVTFRS